MNDHDNIKRNNFDWSSFFETNLPNFEEISPSEIMDLQKELQEIVKSFAYEPKRTNDDNDWDIVEEGPPKKVAKTSLEMKSRRFENNNRASLKSSSFINMEKQYGFQYPHQATHQGPLPKADNNKRRQLLSTGGSTTHTSTRPNSMIPLGSSNNIDRKTLPNAAYIRKENNMQIPQPAIPAQRKATYHNQVTPTMADLEQSLFIMNHLYESLIPALGAQKQETHRTGMSSNDMEPTNHTS